MKLPFGWTLAELRIKNTNDGIGFRILEAYDVCMEDCGPQTWTMKGVTISQPIVPFYIPKMNTGIRFLKGREPVCRIQVSRLADGDVLGISMSHMITDGIHWPLLMRHVAARYREALYGRSCDPSELLEWDGRKGTLTLESLRQRLGDAVAADWQPSEFPVKAKIGEYWKSFMLLIQNEINRVDYNIVYVSRSEVSQLKTTIQDILGVDHPAISSGDVVQGLGAMMMHAAQGKPMLPEFPKCMLVLIQIPGIDERYFGNAVHPMPVCFEPGQDLDVPPLKILTKLVSAIRHETIALRSDSTRALQSLYETEQVCNTRIATSLAFLAGNRLPYVTCTTNYIGSLKADRELDFGLPDEEKPKTVQWWVTPLAQDMCVIRPACSPYPEGLFFYMSLTRKESERLRSLPFLSEILQKPIFV